MSVETRRIRVVEKQLDPIFRTIKNPVYEKVGVRFVDGDNETKWIQKCNLCGLNGTGKRCIAPSFVQSPKAIFIGRNPGEAEAYFGDIFNTQTPSGAMFWHYLNQLGLQMSEVYVTNVCHCSTPRNRAVLEEEVRRCSGWKIAEFKNMNIPDFIFLMGQDALRLFYGYSHPSILSVLGDIYISEWQGKPRYFIPIVHPAFICRDKEWMASASNILKIARELMNKNK